MDLVDQDPPELISLSADRRPKLVGFVGVGAMGSAVARLLLEAGIALTVFDPNPVNASAMAKAGAHIASKLEELATCDVVFTCLPTSDDVSKVLPTIAAAAIGPRLFIDLTTGDPAKTRWLASQLAADGHSLIDASISGGILAAKAGTMALFVGGDYSDLGWAASVLAILSPARLQFAGPVGAGQLVKLLNNYLAGMGRWLMAEALGIAMASGLDAGAFVEACDRSWAHTHHSSVTFPECVLSRKSSQQFRLALMVKDLRLAIQTAEAIGVPLPGATSVLTFYEEAGRALGSNAEVNDVVPWILENFGVPPEAMLPFGERVGA
jgi:3-hydroxyisobutyrate dehydrogenase